MMRLVALALGLSIGLAQAQDFPSRALRIVVPAPAGSSPDIRARQIAGKLNAAFGQPVIVDNRPGGAGLIAAREAAKAAPDGYTMLLALINNAIADALNSDACCRLNQELLPVSRFTMTPLVVVVNPSLPVKTLKEYLGYAASSPGKLTFASAGAGSISQLVGAWLQSEGGVRMLEVPYKGVNAEIPDLISGQVMSGYIVPQVVITAVKSARLRPLAVLSGQRIRGLPDVPTSAEAGMPGVEAIVWNGIFVPAGTPRPIVEVLHREVARAYNAPDIKAQVEATGSSVVADTPEEFAAFIRAETAKWGKVGSAAGLKAPQ